MLIQAMICPADILLLFLLNKSNPQNPGEPRGFSSWGPHSPGLRFSGELQTLDMLELTIKSVYKGWMAQIKAASILHIYF